MAIAIKKPRTRPRGFVYWNPKPETAALVAAVRQVIAQYVPTYGPMTLRQIFYRLVATAAYPKTERAYKNLGEHLQSARRARLIPFADMRDDSLVIERADGWDSIGSFVDTIGHWVDQYTLQRDIGQPCRTVVMVEAAGMVPMVARIVAPYGAEVRSGGGFTRVTGNHALACDIAALYEETGRPTRLLHLGDYDSSGEHIHPAFFEDVGAFVADQVDVGTALLTERVALTEAQIMQFGLPTAPGKVSDHRTFAGIGGDGISTVQLEALAPSDLAQIVETAILAHWDTAAYAALKAQESDDRKQLAMWLARR